MKKIALLLSMMFFTSSLNQLSSQEKPTDILSRLPDINTKICSSSKDELAVYAKSIGDLISLVNSNLESLAPLKIKAKTPAKITSKSNTATLSKQLNDVNAIISKKDFSVDFSAALHDGYALIKDQKIEAINLKSSQTDDYAEMLKLIDETHTVYEEYCNNSSPHYIELLLEQRSLLLRDLEKIILANDLKQQIDCNVLGYTYNRVLSFENAYLYILDHLNYMYLSLSFAPGQE